MRREPRDLLRDPATTASSARNLKTEVPLAARKKCGTLLGVGHRNLLEALQEVDDRPPLVAVLRARAARRLLINVLLLKFCTIENSALKVSRTWFARIQAPLPTTAAESGSEDGPASLATTVPDDGESE